jgi:hypothetical protein
LRTKKRFLVHHIPHADYRDLIVTDLEKVLLR